MKKLIALSFVLSSVAALAEATVSDVIVRQQWPWSPAVNVEFLVGGSSGALAEVTLAAYAGDTFLGYVPQAKCTGDTMISSDGLKRIAFDPTAIDFLAQKGVMDDFRVDVAVRDTPEEEILYKIYDLTKAAGEPGQVTCVTEFDLTNGVYGAWTRNYWGADMAQTVVWTGVTQNNEYKTTKLVMRRIPAGSFSYGQAVDSGYFYGNEITNTTVTISQPYYVGVFELTVAQESWIMNYGTKSTSTMPSVSTFYFSHYTAADAIRAKPATAAYNWPTGKDILSGSLMDKLRRLTNVDFDLATEAQWEKAARAGSTGLYYSSNSNTPNDTELAKLAWCRASNANLHNVGLLKPNAYGLYDVLGNADEWVLDNYVRGYTPAAIDPEGPEEVPATQDQNRVLKGYDELDYGESTSSDVVHLGGRTYQKAYKMVARNGIRLCSPAQ